MKLAVVGAGHVGLIAAAAFADRGHEVACCDSDGEVIADLSADRATIHEEGLPQLLANARDSGRLEFTDRLSAAMEGVELVLVAVGTPATDDGLDLTALRKAAREIGAEIGRRRDHVSIVVKSTVVPGVTDTLVRQDLECASGKQLGEFGLGANPEFLREGRAVADFTDPGRIVLGSEDARTLMRLDKLYASWTAEKMHVSSRTAEFIKCASNALLACQISFANEIANLAEVVGGVDGAAVMQGVTEDVRLSPFVQGRRIRPEILGYLRPGSGFGGACLPKDVGALVRQGRTLGEPMRMLEAVLATNAAQPGRVVRALIRETGPLRGRGVLVLGLAFKAGTDDVRGSVAFNIVDDLLEAGTRVCVHDPVATRRFVDALKERELTVKVSAYWPQAVANHDIIVVATDWPEYKAITELDLTAKIIFDARRLLSHTSCIGAKYLAVGLGPEGPARS